MTDDEKPGIIYLGTAAELGWDEDSQPSKPLTGWDQADRAAAALQTYHEETDGPGASYGDEGSQEFVEAIEDLLVDLRHLTSRAGVSFPELDEAASARWCEQVEEEEDD